MSDDLVTPPDRDAVLEVRSHLEDALAVLDQLLSVMPEDLRAPGGDS